MDEKLLKAHLAHAIAQVDELHATKVRPRTNPTYNPGAAEDRLWFRPLSNTEGRPSRDHPPAVLYPLNKPLGQAFAKVFAEVWHGIPLSYRQGLLDYWKREPPHPRYGD